MTSGLVHWLMHLAPVVHYAVLCGLALIEGTGLPGIAFEPIFLGTGYLIARGHLSYGLATLSVTAGGVSGNLIGYAIGAGAGRWVRGPLAGRLGLTPARLASIDGWFRHEGGRALFIGRWFGPIRTPAILAAGFTHLHLGVFTAWSAAAAATWSATWLLLTWKFGRAALALLHQFGFRFLVGVAVAAIVVYVGWRWAVGGFGRGEDAP